MVFYHFTFRFRIGFAASPAFKNVICDTEKDDRLHCLLKIVRYLTVVFPFIMGVSMAETMW